MSHLDEEWVREAERLHERYLIEVVEAFGLCPWAQRARLEGQTRTSIMLEAEGAAVGASMKTLDAWAADEHIDIGFLVFPRLKLGRLEFDRFVAHLRAVDDERRPHGRAPFALAAFHPDAEPNMLHAERLVPFLRRTPDPCVQAVRMSTLDRVRRGTPSGTQFVDVATLDWSVSLGDTKPLRERIAGANLETVRRAGVQVVSAHLDAIQSDRARTYRALEAREACDPPGVVVEEVAR
jgi:hypothetical protein